MPIPEIVKVPKSPFFRILGYPIQPGVRQATRCVCTVDERDGSIHVVNTFPFLYVDGNYGPALNYKLEDDGALSLSRGDLRGGTLNFLDPSTLEPYLTFDILASSSSYIPEDETLAAKEILPHFMNIEITGIGRALVLWDDEKGRVLLSKDGIRTYEPGTWKLKDTLFSPEDLAKLNGFPQLKGKPGSGPFAFEKPGNGAKPETIFFNSNCKRIEMPEKYYCFDANASGFLVSNGPAGQLQCLDPETGEQIWVRPDIHRGNSPTHWCGDHVVIDGYRVSDGVQTIDILDGNTGETLVEAPAPPEPFQLDSIVDDLILYKYQGSYVAYKIVPQT